MSKSICFDCSKRHRCEMSELGEHPFAISHCYGYEKGNPTNADRIRAMSDEELAEFISGKARTFGEEYEGYMSALDWLKEEASK